MLFIPDTKWREIIKSNRIEWLFLIRFDSIFNVKSKHKIRM